MQAYSEGLEGCVEGKFWMLGSLSCKRYLDEEESAENLLTKNQQNVIC